MSGMMNSQPLPATPSSQVATIICYNNVFPLWPDSGFYRSSTYLLLLWCFWAMSFIDSGPLKRRDRGKIHTLELRESRAGIRGATKDRELRRLQEQNRIHKVPLKGCLLHTCLIHLDQTCTGSRLYDRPVHSLWVSNALPLQIHSTSRPQCRRLLCI